MRKRIYKCTLINTIYTISFSYSQFLNFIVINVVDSLNFYRCEHFTKYIYHGIINFILSPLVKINTNEILVLYVTLHLQLLASTLGEYIITRHLEDRTLFCGWATE